MSISITIYKRTKNYISMFFRSFHSYFKNVTKFLTIFFFEFRLCSLLGTIFSFVGTEILSKMDVLRELQRSGGNEHFSTMKTMVTYERGRNLLEKSEYVSGSRTLLRLHRGLGKSSFKV